MPVGAAYIQALGVNLRARNRATRTTMEAKLSKTVYINKTKTDAIVVKVEESRARRFKGWLFGLALQLSSKVRSNQH